MTCVTTTTTLLLAARAGDHDAFGRLLHPHCAGLHAYCYRMLGSLRGADAALRETRARCWGAGVVPERPLRPWLFGIATAVCLDAEAAPLEPYPDARRTPAAGDEERAGLELAFVAALQRLPGRRRAVLILRDVLGFSAGDAAAALGTTPAAVERSLRRARRDGRLPARSQQATLRRLGERRAELLARHVAGREAQHVVTSANGQPAIAWYERGRPASIEVLTFGDEQVAGSTAFAAPELFPAFGLPAVR
jgi:RNA polymerase sigma-70 factor (ECF subfamily)